ncbi:ferritin-like fold-containing protein [uncultured Leifsonia sp.]|uniref:ferritin-like fold-containing protein n=3 Tax=Leifsonia TaxID=110932 RepID=UPI0028D6741A|nr:ferritin-like fold-containing protein [uncultured Leifsonia sp.]
MTTWFTRRRPPVELPRLAARAPKAPAVRVDLHDVMPDLLPYLGQAAYLQLEQFQTLSAVAGEAEGLKATEGVAAAAGLALSKHQGIVAEIRRRGDDPTEAMRPFAVAIEGFRATLVGSDWRETLLAALMTGGLLDDFFIRLAGGLPGDIGPRVSQLLGSDSGQEALLEILREEIGADPRLASRLAMWGRRLVGDTLLVARSALHLSGNTATDEERIEPIFTELIAAHTRRMDALGLTA